MIKLFPQGAATLAVFVVLGLGVAGCAGNTPSPPAAPGEAAETQEPAPEPEPEPEPAPDLAGEWTQSNSQSEDAYQAATITADTIEIFWVSDGGSTRSLYWAGTFEAPTDSGAYSWDSTNDTEQTSGAILASSDPTKTFSFDNDVIRYDVSALGTTTTVELGR